MSEIITLGESMVSFVPNSTGALRYVADFKKRIAGAESNLAIGLSKLGVDVAWISKLGNDEFGEFVLNSVRAEGVDTKAVVFDPIYPTGIMFKETGEGESKVFYYRKGSAASNMSPEDLNNPKIEDYFKRAKILHLTGITPVLSETCKEITLESIKLAKQNNLKISFDPNIRKKLWKDNDFAPLIRDITLMSDIVLLGVDEAEILFNVTSPEDIASILFSKGNAQIIAVKNSSDGAWVCEMDSTNKINITKIPPYPCTCVEPIGAGDGFNAGFLAGFVSGENAVVCGKMGSIAGALATQTTGDFEGYPSLSQMKHALDGSSEVYR